MWFSASFYCFHDFVTLRFNWSLKLVVCVNCSVSVWIYDGVWNLFCISLSANRYSSQVLQWLSCLVFSLLALSSFAKIDGKYLIFLRRFGDKITVSLSAELSYRITKKHVIQCAVKANDCGWVIFLVQWHLSDKSAFLWQHRTRINRQVFAEC